MKRGKTRKNSNRNNMYDDNMYGGNMYGGNMYGGNMYGGARSYAPSAFNVDVLTKLTEFTAEINELSRLADTYRTRTEALNSSSAMADHLNSANSIKQRAAAAYEKAKQFWTTVYGTDWTPPPEPAPVPVPAAL